MFSYRKRRKNAHIFVAKDNNDDIGMLSVNDNDISLSSCEDSSSSIVPSVNESTDDEITSSLVSLRSDGTIDDDEVLQDDKDISLSYTFNVDELEKFLNESNALLQPKDCNDFIHPHDSSLLTVGAFAEKFMEICEFNNINDTGMLYIILYFITLYILL